jgi:peptide/nickel transport system substrate-binding protein
MKHTHLLAKSLLLIVTMPLATAALAQKYGGTLRGPLRANPTTASIHEESSVLTNQPFMALFNNLVMFDQHVKRASAESIVPDLATEWSWSPDNTVLTMKLRQGVTWHDGKPFTSADVKCTWDMITGKRTSGWRRNPREEWYDNLKEVSVAGPHEVRFTLGRPQPSFLTFLAVGASPVYPCHVDGPTMRRMPIGTGPFKLTEWKPGNIVRLVKNPNYWKPGRPYLDAIEWRIVSSQSTRALAFVAGEFDITFVGDVTQSTLKDIRAQAPKAICETNFPGSTGQILMNHNIPPFDNPKVRRAVALALDRNKFVEATLGEGRLGGIMSSPPYGTWGLSPEQLEAVPGMGKDGERSRAEARKLMAEAGYGPKKPLKATLILRIDSGTRGQTGTAILADQLRSIYIEGDVQPMEYSMYVGAMMKGAYAMGFHGHGLAIDDPDAMFYEGYKCGSIRNLTKYCNKQVDAMIEEQSSTVDPVKRKALVHALDLFVQQDVARPIMHQNANTSCRYPHVKGFIWGTNSNHTHNRMEDLWLDK